MPTPFTSPDGFFIKSLRFDQFCFISDFIAGVTHTPEQKKPNSPRLGKHRAYTVFNSGVYKRTEKPLRYSEAELAKKSYLSPHQSVSLVIKDAETPVFGHKSRSYALAGVIIDPNDTLLNRWFMYDGGTIKRAYEFDYESDALAYYNTKKNYTLFETYADFKAKQLTRNSDKNNEVLARIRWNPESSAIGIFSDTDESRYVAQIYAAKLRQALKSKVERLNGQWDEAYQVPIYYYIPGSSKNYQLYTPEAIELDKNKANALLSNPKQRDEEFDNDQFACLLLANSPQAALDIQWKNKPILLSLIQLGLFHIAKDMVERAGYDTIADYLKKNQLVKEAQAVCSWNSGFVGDLVLVNRIDLLETLATIADPADIDHPFTSGNLLYQAANNGYLEAVRLLLDHGANINAVFKYNNETALVCAAKHDKLDIVRLILSKPSSELNANEPYLVDLFLKAVQTNDLITINLLLLKGMDVNVKNSKNKSALMLAVETGHIEMVKRLLEEKPDLNAKDGAIKTALVRAVEAGHIEIIRCLLENGADIYDKEVNSDSVLDLAAKNDRMDIVQLILTTTHTELDIKSSYALCLFVNAIQNNRLDEVNLLLSKGMNVDVKKVYDNKSPLMHAAQSGHIEIVQRLLEKKADIHAYNFEGTALIYATKSGHDEVVQCLLEQGADANAKDHNGNTAWMWAANSGHSDILRRLLKHAHPSLKESDYNSLMWTSVSDYVDIFQICISEAKDAYASILLREAVRKNNLDKINLLLSLGVDINAKVRFNGTTALIEAVECDHIEIFERLLEKNANVNLKNFKGDTALMVAFQRYKTNPKIISLLLEDKAIAINEQNSEGQTALMYAFTFRSPTDCIRRLLESGADLYIQDSKGRSALSYAASTGNFDCINLLLTKKDFEFNAKAPYAIEMLFSAVNNGNIPLFNLLLARGVDINSEDESGKTPLIIAAQQNKIAFARYLIDLGVNITAKSSRGYTPADYAREDTIKLLERAQLTPNTHYKKSQTLFADGFPLEKKEAVEPLNDAINEKPTSDSLDSPKVGLIPACSSFFKVFFKEAAQAVKASQSYAYRYGRID